MASLVNQQIVVTESSIYIPAFNEETGEYVDKCPYQPYQRNTVKFECRCRVNAYFHNRGKYNQHIKSASHQEWIKNYPKYFKEVDEAGQKIKELTVKSELLERKNLRVNNICQNLISENKSLKETNKRLKGKYDNYKKKNMKSLKQKADLIEEHNQLVSNLENQILELETKLKDSKEQLDTLKNDKNLSEEDIEEILNEYSFYESNK